MTLNVVPFPTAPKDWDIATDARAFADALDAGEFGEVESVIVLVAGHSMHMSQWGEPVSMEQAIGALEVVKTYLVNEMLG